ncbi:hypothetical protein CFB89_17625 [Burkholderia sp. AU16741]|uniref:hypothetical protein n=1 Tax=unclassified Burkholderia TaxID=2613784 RepID=UPI000B7A30AD|nr:MULTISPECIES: hypothetical protein [unclassified Burkholderia]MDN7425963.1 hypothetical protein [Burkholderia sp. AU45388]OXI31290.1 hypothetical protein CFB89_17625 [Burkholderia sp. AU16741]
MIDDASSLDAVDPVRIELRSLRGGFALAGDACAAMEGIVNDGRTDTSKDRWPAFRGEIACAVDR